MTYEEALRYYEETAVYGSRLGLDRVRELLAKLVCDAPEAIRDTMTNCRLPA